MYLKEEYTNINILSIKSTDILEDIFTYPRFRQGYNQTQDSLLVPTFFCHIQGIFDNYEKKLIDFDKKLSQDSKSYLRLINFNEEIPQDFIDKFNKSWEDTKLADADLITKNLSEVFELICNNKVLTDILKEKFNAVLKLYLKQQLNIGLAKSSIIKIMYLCKKHYQELMNRYYIQEDNPKILSYGQLYRDDLYFLLLMYFCSVDIVYFNPTRQEKFPFPRDIIPYIETIKYNKSANISKIFLSQEKDDERQETVAYTASKEIDSILHSDSSSIYTNWQFERYILQAVTMKSTIDEIKQLNNVDARFRQGFEVDDGTIYLPNIFSKISGVFENKAEYFDFFDKSSKDALIIENVPFSSIIENTHIADNLISDNLIDKEAIKKLKEYKFNHLRESVQDHILSTIQEMINKKYALFKFADDESIETDIIYEVLTLERRYLDLLQNFDYAYKVPRIVIFHDNEEVFTKKDGIRIAFFVLFGLDVVIFTPSGYNDVEVVINEFNFDVHRLNNFDSDMKLKDKNIYKQVKKKGFWESLFG